MVRNSLKGNRKRKQQDKERKRQARKAKKEEKIIEEQSSSSESQSISAQNEEIKEGEETISKIDRLFTVIKNSGKRQTKLFKELRSEITDMKAQYKVALQKIELLTNVISNLVQVGPVGSIGVADPNSIDSRNSVLAAAAEASLVKFDIKCDVEKLRIQIKGMETNQQAEKFKLYHNSERFWNYYLELSYVPMALHMEIMHSKLSKPKTIANNLNSLKIFRNLYRDRGVELLTMLELQNAVSYLQDVFQDLRQFSTMNQYLSCLQAMAKGVYGIEELKLQLKSKNFKYTKPIIDKDSLFRVIDECSKSKKESTQLFGLCLYLLFVTAQRNETVRTVEFSQFKYDEENKCCYVELYAAKTLKVSKYIIPQSVYDFVEAVRLQRFEWADDQLSKLGNRDDEYARRRRKLIQRRRSHLFSFFTESAIHYHVKKIKKELSDDIKEIGKFLVHNIRTLKIRVAFEEGGLQKAQAIAQHANPHTTIQHYLNLDQYQQLVEWKGVVSKAEPIDEDEEEVMLEEEQEKKRAEDKQKYTLQIVRGGDGSDEKKKEETMEEKLMYILT